MKVSVVCVSAILLVTQNCFSQDEQLNEAKVIGRISDGQPSKLSVQEPLPVYKIHWSQVHHKNGQKIIVNRVEAPAQAKKLSVIPLTEEDIAKRDEAFAKMLAESKPLGGFFTVSAIIYDHRVTKVRWWHKGVSFSGWSNLDWNHLCGFASFEGRGKQYSMILLPSNTSIKNLQRMGEVGYEVKIPVIPKLPKLEESGPSYMVTEGDEKNEEAMEFMEAIHDLYAAKAGNLVAAYNKRQKQDEIREGKKRKLRLNPPPKKDLIINYWKIKNPKKDQSQTK